MTHVVDQSRRAESVAALWRGEVPLPRVYWFYFFGGNLLLSIPGLLLDRVLGEGTQVPPRWFLTVVLYVAVAVTYYVFTAVAVWRSADRYPGSPWWARLARLAVVIGVLRAVLER